MDARPSLAGNNRDIEPASDPPGRNANQLRVAGDAELGAAARLWTLSLACR